MALHAFYVIESRCWIDENLITDGLLKKVAPAHARVPLPFNKKMFTG